MESRWRSDIGGGINLMPLLDVILSLLFFFIVATNLQKTRQALDITLPRSEQQGTEIREDRVLEILIDRENRIFYEGKHLTPAELQQNLKSLSPRDTDQVVIRSDGQATVQTGINVMDACAQAGFTQILIETTAERSESPAR